MANLNFQQPPRSIANAALTGRTTGGFGGSSMSGHVTPTSGMFQTGKSRQKHMCYIFLICFFFFSVCRLRNLLSWRCELRSTNATAASAVAESKCAVIRRWSRLIEWQSQCESIWPAAVCGASCHAGSGQRAHGECIYILHFTQMWIKYLIVSVAVEHGQLYAIRPRRLWDWRWRRPFK